jgi:hypothetical protein
VKELKEILICWCPDANTDDKKYSNTSEDRMEASPPRIDQVSGRRL